MKESESRETLTEIAIARLTADIVDGHFPPDHKLLIAELKKRYGMGASPLREGLARLASQGFVVFDRRRGFRVAPISREDLEDITRVRQIVETAALARAIEYGDDEWEVGIVGAHTRLQRVLARHQVNGAAEGAELEAAHKLFHSSLIAACRSPRLIELHGVLYDQARRYRQVMLSQKLEPGEFLRTHDALVKVVLSRDAERACATVSGHLGITLQKVYQELPRKAKRVRAASSGEARKARRAPGL